jgi:hypothetical protein
MQDVVSNDIIVITAARPMMWLRKRIGPRGWARGLGEMFSETYGDAMEKLNEVDDEIYDWSKELKGLVDKLRSAYKAKRIIDVAVLLAKINIRFEELGEKGAELEKNVEGMLDKLEVEHEESASDVEMLSNIETLKGKEATAGIREWFVGKRMETKKRRERDLALRSVIREAERTADKVLSYVGELGTARSTGNIGKYLDVLSRISTQQMQFRGNFIAVYNKHLREPVERVLEEKGLRTKRTEEVAKETPPEAPSEVKIEEAKPASKSVEQPAPSTVPKARMPAPSPEKAPSTVPGSAGVSEEGREAALWKLPVPQEVGEWEGPPTVRSRALSELTDDITKMAATFRGGEFGKKEIYNLAQTLIQAYTGLMEMGEFTPEELAGLAAGEYGELSELPSKEPPQESGEYEKYRPPTPSEGAPATVRELHPGPETEPYTTKDPEEAFALTQRGLPPSGPETEREPRTLRSLEMPEFKQYEEAVISPGGLEEYPVGVRESELKEFFDALKKEAGDNPYKAASMIVRYAGEIEDRDLDVSLKLLAVAEGYLNG